MSNNKKTKTGAKPKNPDENKNQTSDAKPNSPDENQNQTPDVKPNSPDENNEPKTPTKPKGYVCLQEVRFESKTYQVGDKLSKDIDEEVIARLKQLKAIK